MLLRGLTVLLQGIHVYLIVLIIFLMVIFTLPFFLIHLSGIPIPVIS